MVLSRTLTRIRHGYEYTVDSIESGVKFLERRYTPLGRFTPGPFEGWGFLWQPALIGFVALTAILVGASFTDSPFKLEQPNTWFFGAPTQTVNPAVAPNESTLILGIVLVFGGLFLLMRVWLRLAEIARLHHGAPVRHLWKIFGLWSIPMIIAPPLFSRDIFSYAAQGWMTMHHISPYQNGPFTIGSNPFEAPVDHLWWNAPAPYGPLFLFLDGTIVRVTGQRHLPSLVGLRLLELAAVIILGVGIVMLAKALGRDPGESFILGVMNPLVLLTLIGGAHNDALMAGLLAVGVAFAVKKRPIIAVLFITSAAAIKAPAALGLLYVAWTWLGPDQPVSKKLKPFLVTGVVSGLLLGVYTLLPGFGFGWVKNLASPGTVRSWAAPATGSAMAIHSALGWIGVHISATPVISVTRAIGFVLAVVAAGWLLLHAERRGWVRSLGLSLVLFVILGPVVQPWYLVWGIVLLAASYEGREHFWLLLLSIVAPFMGLPGGAQLLEGLVHASVIAMIAALAILLATVVAPLGSWSQWSWPEVSASIETRTADAPSS